MPWTQIFPVAVGPIRRIILHDKVGTPNRFALTLDFAAKTDLEQVYIRVFDRAPHYGNWDECKGKAYHDELHSDMMAAMGVPNAASTLTDYHQHWVHQYEEKQNSGKEVTKLRLFTSDEVGWLITLLKKQNYMTQNNMVILCQAAA
jgi:hypothetical protein